MGTSGEGLSLLASPCLRLRPSKIPPIASTSVNWQKGALERLGYPAEYGGSGLRRLALEEVTAMKAVRGFQDFEFTDDEA